MQLDVISWTSDLFGLIPHNDHLDTAEEKMFPQYFLHYIDNVNVLSKAPFTNGAQLLYNTL